MRVVFDTNVWVAGLRSRRGASFALIQRLGSPKFTALVSVPLCLEYEDVLRRPGVLTGYSAEDITEFLDYFLSVAEESRIHYLWRPYVPDPKDDHVLEVALAGSASHIITHNVRDFRDVPRLGISVVTPDQFLAILSAP